MRRFTENLARIAAITGALGGEPEALAEKRPSTADLVLLQPKDYSKIPLAEQATMATRAFSVTEKYLPHDAGAAKKFTELELATQQKLAPSVFERTRLVNVGIRNKLRNYAALLDDNQSKAFETLAKNIHQNSKGTITLTTYSEFVTWLNSQDDLQLRKVFQELDSALKHQEDTSLAPVKTKKEKIPEPQALTPTRLPTSPENTEVHLEASVDAYGKPFDWNRRNIKYYDQEPEHADLVPPFVGKGTKGQTVQLQLRQGPFEAFRGLCQDFTMHAPKNIQLYGCYATEAFRTLSKQRGILTSYQARDKREGTHTAKLVNEPGFSEHHLGTTVDIHELKRKGMYEWFVGSERDLKIPNFIPRIVQYGFVPTVADEPWHFRHVGKDPALTYWKKYGEQIIKNHHKSLVN